MAYKIGGDEAMRSKNLARLGTKSAVLAAVALGFFHTLTPAPAAEFIPLGPDSSVWVISGDGSTVFGFISSTSYAVHSWTPSTGWKHVTDELVPTSVNRDGTVLAGYRQPDDTREAVRWTESGGGEGLGFLPGMVSSQAYGISADGSIVVGDSMVGPPFAGQAFRWMSAGGIQSLGTLDAAHNQSRATGISADGSVIVGLSGFAGGSNEFLGFRWTENSGMQPLMPLPGYDTGFPEQVSADGQYAVGFSGSFGGEVAQPVRWSATGEVQGLGTLPGHDLCGAADVSGDGSAIVGRCSLPAPGQDVPFLWTERDGMRSLVDVLSGLGLDVTGWTLEHVRGISDDGQSIVGWGINPAGQHESWFVRLDEVLPPDFNGDGMIDCLDVDSLVAEIVAGTHSSTFDLTGDGLVTRLDINDPDLGWLRLAGEENLGPGLSYLEGDANLDGEVDGLDLIEWNAHKFTEEAAWCSGDFNADGLIDGLDFIIWNANKFMSSDGVSAVPEPSTGIAWITTLVILSVARRR